MEPKGPKLIIKKKKCNNKLAQQPQSKLIKKITKIQKYKNTKKKKKKRKSYLTLINKITENGR